MPDMTLGPGGEAIVTSNVVPILWTIDPETLAVTEHPLALDADGGKDVGFSAIVYSPDHAAYFAVSGLHGTLWRIDLRLERAEKVALSTPLHAACHAAVPRRGGVASDRAGAELFVGGTEANWIVDVALGHRSGYVRKTPCAELPWQLRHLAVSCAG
jgi:hypothetical protein